jgi:hypothetical protein
MVTVASIYLRFNIAVRVGVRVGRYLSTPTPPKIHSDSDSTALAVRLHIFSQYSSNISNRQRNRRFINS